MVLNDLEHVVHLCGRGSVCITRCSSSADKVSNVRKQFRHFGWLICCSAGAPEKKIVPVGSVREDSAAKSNVN